ncbi:MAG TPA: tRNA lysidine(34) synthetase TilS [bacterium]|nr:tRNA lysidine(34) synthetase TilS [bacterium]
MLLRTVHTTIEKYNMLAGGERVVVALSGGPDSVALLHVLVMLRSTYQLELHAAHLEHGLRGEQALEDMRFVESLCHGLGIPLTARSAKVAERAASSSLSLEAVGRQVRYAFLEEVMAATGATKIATGHNANDQAETLLLNLLRGSGISGLRGIRPAIEGKIIRPLIEAKREEILVYLKEKGLDFRTDLSNEDEAFDRNRVRRLLVPLVEKEFNPRIVDSLGRTASVFSMVASYFDNEVEAVTKACTTAEDGRLTINLAMFRTVPQIVKLFTLYSLVRSLEGDDQVVSFDTLSALLNVAERSQSGSRVDIGSGITAVKEFDTLVIGRDVARSEAYEATLSVPGTTAIEEAGCSFDVSVMQERPDSADLYTSGATAYFDFDKLELPLVARSWREGDRFVPFGLSGSKKVHDVFIDEKMPVSERSRTPIVCDREDILWLAGVRRAERARITDGTKTILKITYRKDGATGATAD